MPEDDRGKGSKHVALPPTANKNECWHSSVCFVLLCSECCCVDWPLIYPCYIKVIYNYWFKILLIFKILNWYGLCRASSVKTEYWGVIWSPQRSSQWCPLFFACCGSAIIIWTLYIYSLYFYTPPNLLDIYLLHSYLYRCDVHLLPLCCVWGTVLVGAAYISIPLRGYKQAYMPISCKILTLICSYIREYTRQVRILLDVCRRLHVCMKKAGYIQASISVYTM
jgi:hypothetical protein